MSLVLDYNTIGEEARCQNIYKYLNPGAIPIFESEATFPVGRKNSKSGSGYKKAISFDIGMGCYNTHMPGTNILISCC